MTNFVKKVSKLLSKQGFTLAISLFLTSALWFVFSATYPLPFDEYAHYGAIQIFAEQWSPFIANQPSDSGIVGDLTRNPSTLYYLIMSYPYRLFATLFTTEQAVIIGLRLLSVSFVVVGIVLFRKLFLEWGLPKRVVNVALLIFLVTPIVPFLSAHINYDNLLFMITPLVLLYAGRIIRGDKKIFTNLGLLLLATLLAVTTKQTFLPVALVVWLYVAVTLSIKHKRNVLNQIAQSYIRTSKGLGFFVVAIGTLLLSVIAFERYGLNVIRYQSLQPKCEEVQSIDFCRQFGPWYRNNVINVENRPAEPPYGNPVSYSQYWITRMYRGYFANFSHTPTVNATNLEPYGPIETKPLLPMHSVAGIVFLSAGLLAVCIKRRQIWSSPMLRFATVVFVGFIIIQWGYNYSSYLPMWKAEAIQARYTIPVLLLAIMLLVYAVDAMITRRSYKAALLLILVVTYVYGGGAVGWIIRSSESWRWQYQSVQTINNTVQGTLKNIVPH